MMRVMFKYLAAISGGILFLISLFSPTTIMLPKYVLLPAFVVFLLFYTVMGEEFLIDKNILTILISVVCVGILWTVYGVYLQNPGAHTAVTVYIFYPFLFIGIVVTSIKSLESIKLINVALVFGGWLIVLYTYSYIGYSAGILPSELYIPLNLQQNIGFYGGFVEYTMDNVATLLFLVPYLIAAGIIWPRDLEYSPPKWAIWALLIFALPLVVLSGRRMLQIVTLISIFTTYIIWYALPNRERTSQLFRFRIVTILFASASMILVTILNATVVDLSVVFERIIRSFDPSRSASTSHRARQFVAMMDGLESRPLIGYGFGSVVEEVIRSSEAPWAYELMYVKLLYNVGLIGFIPYLVGFCWMCHRLLSIIQTGSVLGYHAAPMLVASISFIISSATNPYLNKFGYMWVIFIPVGVAHLACTDDESETKLPRSESKS